MTEAEGCTDIPASYPDLEYVRGFEAENDVNKGGESYPPKAGS